MFASRTAFNVRSVEADRLVREGLLTTEKAVEGEVIHNEMIITSNSKNRNRCCIMVEIWCLLCCPSFLLACFVGIQKKKISITLYCTVLYCTVLYCTVLYCIAASHPIYLILLPVCTVQYQVVEAQSVIDDQQQVLSSKSLITT